LAESALKELYHSGSTEVSIVLKNYYSKESIHMTSTSFKSFDFHPTLYANIEKLKYTDPTPIQKEAIPLVMNGGDVIGLAQTGTGKTAAFLLPIIQRLLNTKTTGLRTLILVPTRELADQIKAAAVVFLQGTSLKATTIYGGVGARPQVEVLQRGVDIVVACPGRLLDHIRNKTIQLRDIEVLVLDEADQMFDMGFLPDIRKILAQLPKNRQSLLFSATMPPEIKKLTIDILKSPQTVHAGENSPSSTVAHALYPVAQHLKTKLLIELLGQISSESVVVFTRTKYGAKRVDEALHKANFKTASLHGNLSHNRRQSSMNGFRSGEFQILVATDIAARGIDISTVSHVINFDMPSTTEAYTHRIGRTGRAQKTGDAFTFYTPEDEDMIRRIERTLKSNIARKTIEGFDYSAGAPVGAKASEERGRMLGATRGRGGQQQRSSVKRAPVRDGGRTRSARPEHFS
jgi:ATP-dependent RNA helicase RhlE